MRILALDYGRARIGMAIADAQTALAQPLGTLDRINRNEDMRRLRELVREHGVRQIVVGLPLRLDGTRGDMAEEAARFLHQACRGLPGRFGERPRSREGPFRQEETGNPAA